ncbi:10383_t:CDS:2, partial [Racocetra persica]
MSIDPSGQGTTGLCLVDETTGKMDPQFDDSVFANIGRELEKEKWIHVENCSSASAEQKNEAAERRKNMMAEDDVKYIKTECKNCVQKSIQEEVDPDAAQKLETKYNSLENEIFKETKTTSSARSRKNDNNDKTGPLIVGKKEKVKEIDANYEKDSNSGKNDYLVDNEICFNCALAMFRLEIQEMVKDMERTDSNMARIVKQNRDKMIETIEGDLYPERKKNKGNAELQRDIEGFQQLIKESNVKIKDFKEDGLLSHDIRIGLLRETPNKELMLEVEKRIGRGEIDLPALIKYLETKLETKKKQEE